MKKYTDEQIAAIVQAERTLGDLAMRAAMAYTALIDARIEDVGKPFSRIERIATAGRKALSRKITRVNNHRSRS